MGKDRQVKKHALNSDCFVHRRLLESWVYGDCKAVDNPFNRAVSAARVDGNDINTNLAESVSRNIPEFTRVWAA